MVNLKSDRKTMAARKNVFRLLPTFTDFYLFLPTFTDFYLFLPTVIARNEAIQAQKKAPLHCGNGAKGFAKAS